jgi:hypothetical protein
MGGAASLAVSQEAEVGTRAGNVAPISDTAASAGSAVRFGTATPGKGPLTWAPPVLSNPITLELTTAAGVHSLDKTKDYIIKMPNGIKGDTFLNGGRNVVMIGGHISTGSESSRAYMDSPEHRGIYITQATGTVHIEGVLIDASRTGAGDGIAINAPNAIIQIQNTRIVGLIGGSGSNHADVIQAWGGLKELRVDRLTGSTNYQGLHIQPELRPNGPEIIKNTNVSSHSTTAGNWLVWLTHSDNTCDTAARVELSEVYVTPRPGRTLRSTVWPSDSQPSACKTVHSAGETILSFPNLPSVTGVIKKGPPPGGDFVPAGVAGLNYVSPGYQ